MGLEKSDELGKQVKLYQRSSYT